MIIRARLLERRLCLRRTWWFKDDLVRPLRRCLPSCMLRGTDPCPESFRGNMSSVGSGGGGVRCVLLVALVTTLFVCCAPPPNWLPSFITYNVCFLASLAPDHSAGCFLRSFLTKNCTWYLVFREKPQKKKKSVLEDNIFQEENLTHCKVCV